MQNTNPLELSMLSTQEVFHVRITSPHVSLPTTMALFHDYNYCISSIEGADDGVRMHQHVLLAADKLDKTDIRSKILSQYPDAKGNQGHSIKKARSVIDLICYVLKDDNYEYYGFTQDFIEKAYKLSYQKDGFKKEYKKLQDQLVLETISLRKYAKALVELKAKYNQPIYINHLRAHVFSMGIKIQDPWYNSDTVVDLIFSNR